MARTALTEAECKEYFDNPELLKQKIKKLATLVKKSKHFVAFTGAGISTSAGIADYRSGVNTVLDTGAGAWAKRAALQQGQTVKAAKRRVSSLHAYPTPSHMALVQLIKHGYLKYLISQNTDGLHRRSGIPPNKLSELHGNGKLERCSKCNKDYLRDYRCSKTRKQGKQLSDKEKVGRYRHRTGRICTVDGCNGNLEDTIVSFGESLPFDPLAFAQQNSDKADLYLSLGSSLGVTPARDMPAAIGKKWKKEAKKNKNPNEMTKHNLVIVNLQKTPLHPKCSLPIFAKIDDVMVGLMEELNLEIPQWNLNRYIRLICKENKLFVCGVDSDGTPFQVFKKLKLLNNKSEINAVNRNDIEWEYVIPKMDTNKVDIVLKFYGNYKEPNLLINVNDLMGDLKKNGMNGIVLRLMFNPKSGKWHKPQIWNCTGDDLIDSKDICLMQLYKTSYGYDGKNAILFGGNKMNEKLFSPDKITKYIVSGKYNLIWIEGKSGKEDLMTYTSFYHQFGLLYCYYFDYYVPKIKIKMLNKIIFSGLINDEYNNIAGSEFDKILCVVCEYEGVCNLLNDFICGDFMNPYPFHKNLMIKRMFDNMNGFSKEWQSFINTYSKYRQIEE
eukprot:208671_1